MEKGKSVVIIGGGLGGLFTGAILSHEGMKVTILEKNSTIGGGLQSFKRFGMVFDTGMHVVAGLGPNGNIRKICQYLGVMDKMQIMDVDDDCTDLLYFAEDKAYYRIAKGRGPFVESLSSYFPEERVNLQNYVEAIYRLTSEVSLFNIQRTSESLFAHSEEFIMAADAFIAKYIKDGKLRSIIAYMNPLYGGRGNQTPAYVHAIINVLYINGASRFKGGSYLFAETLADCIRAHGGTVLTNNPVTKIEVENREVKAVVASKGVYHADYYICDIHPCSMFKLMDEKALPKSYRDRLNSIPNSYSAFSLYIKMKENSFPYINHSVYYMTTYRDIWNFGQMDKPWPLGFLLMTSPELNQGEYSKKVLLTAPMPMEMCQMWENTVTGHRGESYRLWKKQCTDRLLDRVEDVYPGFRDKIEAINSSSPLTIRDYYNVKDGSLSGFSKDYNNLALSQVPVVTKIRNLLLTGQNNNLHGFCGVPLTAINTCEAIFGLNYIVDKINQAIE